MANLTCSPSELLAATPCIQCLSKKQILTVLALSLCKIVNENSRADCDPATLLSDGNCFPCMSDTQLLQALLALVLNYGIDSGYVEAGTGLIDDAACLLCLSDHQLKSIILKQFCEGINNGTILPAVLQ